MRLWWTWRSKWSSLTCQKKLITVSQRLSHRAISRSTYLTTLMVPMHLRGSSGLGSTTSMITATVRLKCFQTEHSMDVSFASCQSKASKLPAFRMVKYTESASQSTLQARWRCLGSTTEKWRASCHLLNSTTSDL
jgi:hypothetical protein